MSINSAAENTLSITLVETGVWGGGHKVESSTSGEKDSEYDDTHNWVGLTNEIKSLNFMKALITYSRVAQPNFTGGLWSELTLWSSGKCSLWNSVADRKERKQIKLHRFEQKYKSSSHKLRKNCPNKIT